MVILPAVCWRICTVVPHICVSLNSDYLAVYWHSIVVIHYYFPIICRFYSCSTGSVFLWNAITFNGLGIHLNVSFHLSNTTHNTHTSDRTTIQIVLYQDTRDTTKSMHILMCYLFLAKQINHFLPTRARTRYNKKIVSCISMHRSIFHQQTQS